MYVDPNTFNFSSTFQYQCGKHSSFFVLCFISNLSPSSIKAERGGHAVLCSPERQTKEQTHPNNLKSGAQGALQVARCLSDPPSKYKRHFLQ